MKTPQEWAEHLKHCKNVTGCVEAVRAEFAREVAAKLHKEVCDERYGEREKLCFGIAAAIVEALASPAKEQPEDDSPIRCGTFQPHNGAPRRVLMRNGVWCCDLARRGHHRDGCPGKPQAPDALMPCDPDCPLHTEGNHVVTFQPQAPAACKHVWQPIFDGEHCLRCWATR